MPRRKSSLADDLVLVTWWVSLILAIVAPAFLIRMPLPWSALAPLVLLFFLATAALSALRSIKTARMLEGQTSLASLRQLPWKRFEDLLGEAYRRQGYKVEETLGGGADGGVDLILGRDGRVTLVQCKRWNGAPVGVRQVRELYGFYTIVERAQQRWSRPLALRRMQLPSPKANQLSLWIQTSSCTSFEMFRLLAK